MTTQTYTVQLSYANYVTRTETVEADSLEAALDLAIVQSNDSREWTETDLPGPTFVDAVSFGHQRLYEGTTSAIPIPFSFTETGVRRLDAVQGDPQQIGNIVAAQGWNEESQLIHLMAFIKERGLM